MENIYTTYNYQYLVCSEIEALKAKQIKNENDILEMNCYIQNIQSFYQNKIEILEKKLYNKESIKSKDQKETYTKLTENKNKKTIRKCWFYNKGYCRSKTNCQFSHPQTFCKIKDCRDKECEARHIKDCKNYFKNACKFGKSCEYKHN